MKKRIFTLALALTMVFQTMVPVTSFAKETTPEQNNLVKVGAIDVKSYPQLDAKTVQEANRRKKQELQGRKMEKGAQLFSSPYFPKPGPDDNQKPLIFANVNAIFTTKGLDGGNFDWEGVFGKDSDGKLNKAQIVFEQMDDKTSTRTGVKFFLKVDKAGTYTWSDSEGKPTKLPLYSTDLKPYRYEVLLDEDVTEHVKLLTARFIGTEGGYAFGKPDPDTGEIVGNIKLDLSLQQIASTKFTSKWNTGVAEAERPTVEGSYLTGYEADPEDYGIFKFPSNDTDKTIIRNDALDPQNPGEYSEYIASQLDKTPKVGVADPDPDATDTYTLDRANKKISYKGKTYKYEVEYDVIKGGKLTMTEILPVTFDANGGKFASITDSAAKQEIKKEVEYDGTLTDLAEEPTKENESFKGWSLTKNGEPLSDVDLNKAIKNIKEAKTFYAIYGKASAKISYLDLDGKAIDDKFKLAETKYPVDKEGKAGTVVDKAEYTGKTAPKFIGYKFNRVELNPKDAKYAFENQATIKIYYEKLRDIIPQKENGQINAQPDGYVKLEFLEGKHGDLTGQQTVYYVNPKKEKYFRDIPRPTVTEDVGYKHVGWNLVDNYKFKEGATPITAVARYEDLPDVIPQENTDGSDKPSGYKTVKFVGENGSLGTTTVYYVNPDKEVDFTDTVKAFTKTPDFAYTEVGGTWSEEIKAQKFDADKTFTFKFKKLGNVISQTKNDESEKPKGYVKVTLIPTDKATDKTNKVYFVNPKEIVKIKNKPIGKEVTDANGSKSSFKFIGWTVTSGTIKSWSDENITDKFIQDTEITAKYEFAWINIVKEPIAAENVVTGKGDKPNPEDLIKNKYDKDDPKNTNNLPEGTTFTYEEKPKVDEAGNITAKVKVGYPGGATTIVEVPITVVDNVVPQVGNDKPLVPGTYVKVTVDTTDKATDNTQFKKVFWVKPNVEVTIDEVKNPTGKEETIGDVTKTNKFVKWQRQGATPDKFYETEIKDIFAEKTETTIVAVYEQDENVAPKPNNNLDVPQGSKPNAKDFINNVYNDNDPKNKDNLPPGTKLEFVPGQEPNTKDLGQDKQTTIKVIYPNGETKTVNVKYNVTNDVAEQEKGKDKPAVPADFVKVTVDTTDKATDQTKFERTFWVNPKKQVTIPVDNPIGKVGENDDGKIVQWKFTDWNKSLTGTFKKETTITAQYEEVTQVPGSVGYLVTDEGVQPTAAQYKDRIQPPEGKKIAEVELVEQPDVSKPGVSTAKLKVTYTDGTSSDVTMTVFVQGKPQGDWQTGTLGSTRILTVVEKEVVKVPAEKTFRKEVRYMQGFNNYFRPTEGLTRAEAAQILANALVEDGYRYDPNFAIRYKDIVGNEWYAKAIRITSQANVFKGYDTGYFDPHKKITRAEWIGTLRRFQELERAPGNHMQVRPDHWAMGEIEAAYKEGWLAIYGQGLARFNADEFIPRQEVAAVSNKAFNRVLDKTYIHRNSKNLINYKDVNSSMWSYEDILCASNGYLHDGKSFWGHKIDYKKDLYNINLDGYTVTKDKFQRLERR